jgi:hypothetical protein
VVVVAGAAVSQLVDPEMARGRADYERAYQVLTLVRTGVLLTTAGLALLLWVLCCYWMLRARRRALAWLGLAVAGPLGLAVIAMLADRSPGLGVPSRWRFGKLGPGWRVPLELALFVAVWILAYEAIVLKRGLMIALESFLTGTPVSTIVAQQSASSGMWAFGEGLEVIYLVMLAYAVRPLVLDVAVRLAGRRRSPPGGR